MTGAAAGPETRYQYDFLGRLVTLREPDPDGPAPLASPVWTYAYDAASQLVLVVDPILRDTTYVYDGLGRTTSVTDELNQTTRYAYDAVSNLFSVTDALSGGSLGTLRPTLHTTTNLDVVREFLQVEASLTEVGPDNWLVEMNPA